MYCAKSVCWWMHLVFLSNSSTKGVSWRPPSSPSSMIKLLPKQSIATEILFRPTAPCQEFQLPLVAECLAESVHGPQAIPVFLCKIAGKCFEAEVRWKLKSRLRRHRQHSVRVSTSSLLGYCCNAQRITTQPMLRREHSSTATGSVVFVHRRSFQRALVYM